MGDNRFHGRTELRPFAIAYCIADSLKKKDPEFGPVTLVLHDAPAKGRVASQELRKFPTARDAIRHVCSRIGSPGFHDPFITTDSPTQLLWDTRELQKECERRTKAPPALNALADYIVTNSGMFVRRGPSMLPPAEMEQRKQRIAILGEEFRTLAEGARWRG